MVSGGPGFHQRHDLASANIGANVQRRVRRPRASVTADARMVGMRAMPLGSARCLPEKNSQNSRSALVAADRSC